MEALNDSFSHLELGEILAHAPVPVQQAIIKGQLAHSDVIRLVSVLKDHEIDLLARAVAKVQDPSKLSALAMNLLSMGQQQSYPFLAKVMAALPDEKALPLAHVVVNRGTHEQMEAILGALPPERLTSFVMQDSKQVSAKVVDVATRLWSVESTTHADKGTDQAAKKALMNQTPVFDEYVSVREAPQGRKEENWMKSQHKLMFNNNDDLLRVTEDWPKQRDWLVGLKGLFVQAANKEALTYITGHTRTQLQDIHSHPARGIRFAYPAITEHDLDRIDREPNFKKAKKLALEIMDRVVARHDELVAFPELERGVTRDADMIALTAREHFSLITACDQQPRDKAEIDLYIVRCKQLMRYTSKHLQHLLFERHAGLLSINVLNHLDFCPTLQSKLETTISEQFLKSDGVSLLAHYRGLRTAMRDLIHKFEALK
jgi:hypothetical protein